MDKDPVAKATTGTRWSATVRSVTARPVAAAMLVGSLVASLAACGVESSSSASSPATSASESASPSPTKEVEYKAMPMENWTPPAGSKYIYLTLDDGPGSNTVEALDVLKKNNVKATFFLIGKMVRTREAMVQRIIDEGHAIGNHTYDHADLASMTKSQIKNQLELAAEKIGPEAGACFRPPFGAIDQEVRQVASKLGMQPVLWTVDTNDWNTSASAASINSRLMEAGPGSIVLAHDAGGDRTATIAGLEKAIPALLKKGYEFATIPICMPGTREVVN